MVLDLDKFRQHRLNVGGRLEVEAPRLPVDRNSWRRDQRNADILAGLSIPDITEIKNALKLDPNGSKGSNGVARAALEDINPNLLRTLRRGAPKSDTILKPDSANLPDLKDLKADMRSKLRLVPSKS